MSQRLSLVLASLFFLAVLGLVLWLGWPEADHSPRGEQVFVVTTIYPLAEFAEQVGGDYVYVSNVVPAGAEPHDYEPSPGDIVQVLQADVLVYVGQGLDTWAADFGAEVTAAGGQAVGAEQKLNLTPGDPHFWLDPDLSVDMVMVIRDALIAKDPAHAADYTANAEAYIKELQTLDHDFAVGLETCQLNAIIVSHDAMGYVARRYGFETLGISGISPEAEPSVRDLTNLARDAKRLKITTIFFETLVSPELAETLAKEVGATTAVLNPLEGLSAEEIAAGDDYLSVMRANLQALHTAMVCQ